jgi:hypothetical protein
MNFMKRIMLLGLGLGFLAFLCACQKEIICTLSEPSIELAYTGAPHKVCLSSNVPWTIEVPSDATWLQITPLSGPEAQEIELTCQAKPNDKRIRQTEVIVKCGNRTLTLTVIQQPLDVIDYTYTVLQKHTQGTYPNEVIIMGDGYSAIDYGSQGSFNRDAHDAMEAFFSVEPFSTYRSYFRVAQLVVFSPESGITESDKNTKVRTAFGVRFDEPYVMAMDNPNLVFQAARRIPGMTEERMRNTLFILLANIDRYGGLCWQYGDGSALALCPVCRTAVGSYSRLADLIHHEAGGHGFGRLVDEYITHPGETLPEEATSASPYRHKKELQERKYYGYAFNVDISGDKEQAPWAHYYTLPGYQAVGYYEGAYFYERGVWRPEERSCMVDNRPYYNAPSRESIVKLLLRRAAGVRLYDYLYQSASGTFEVVPIPNDPFNMEDFMRNDVKKAWSAPMPIPSDTRSGQSFIPTQPIRFIPGSPSL